MAASVKNYYIADSALRRESDETLEALNDLMRKVNRIPSIEIFTRTLSHPFKGTKVVVIKESSDA